MLKKKLFPLHQIQRPHYLIVQLQMNSLIVNVKQRFNFKYLLHSRRPSVYITDCFTINVLLFITLYICIKVKFSIKKL